MLFLSRSAIASLIVFVFHIHLKTANAQSEVEILKEFAATFTQNPWPFETWSTNDPCDGNWLGIDCDENNVLTTLDLGGYSLNGSIPSIIGKLTMFKTIKLHNNYLSGPIPTEFGQLVNTTAIWLFGNDLTGAIPEEFGNLKMLQELLLSNNELTGSVPSGLAFILDLKLDGNLLCNTVPGEPCSPSAPPPSTLLPPQAPSPSSLPPSQAPSPSSLPPPQAPTPSFLPPPQAPSPSLPPPRATTPSSLPPPQAPSPSSLPPPQAPTPSSLSPPQAPYPDSLPPSQAPSPWIYTPEPPSEYPSLPPPVSTNVTRPPPANSTYSPPPLSTPPSPFPSSSPPLSASPPPLAPSPTPVSSSPPPPVYSPPPLLTSIPPPPSPSSLPPLPSSPSPFSISPPPISISPSPQPTPPTFSDSPGPAPLPSLPPPPSPICSPCPAGLVRTLDNSCNCVNGIELILRFTKLQFPSYDSVTETQLVSTLSEHLGTLPFQLRVVDRKAGSVILTIYVLPLVGDSFPDNVLQAIAIKLWSSQDDLPPQFTYEIIDGPKNPKKKKSVPIGIIISFVCGGLAVLIVILIAILFLCYKWSEYNRKRRRAFATTTTTTTTEDVFVSASEHSSPLAKPDKPASQGTRLSIWGWVQGSKQSGETSPTYLPPGAITDSGVKRLEEGEPKDQTEALPKRALMFEASTSGKGEEERPEEEAGEEEVAEDFMSPSSNISHKSIEAIPSKTLQVATKDFNKSNLAGVGIYGKSYKAIMPMGEPAEVLVLSGEKIDTGEFLRYVQLVGTLDCPHLIPLVGYCGERGQRLLVQETTSNASLHDHLHGDLRFARVLTWEKRLQIVIDIAEALRFLHCDLDPPFPHKDVRASNVLLDDNWRAKLKDCGLPGLMPNVTKQFVASNAPEPQAYLSPETKQSNVLNDKTDIFSFGVVMLEIFTGRKPLDTSRPKGQQSLLTWVLPQLASKRILQSMVDPYLRLNSSLDPRMLQRFAHLAGKCVQHDPEDRPTITMILGELQHIAADDDLISARDIFGGSAIGIDLRENQEFKPDSPSPGSPGRTESTDTEFAEAQKTIVSEGTARQSASNSEGESDLSGNK